MMIKVYHIYLLYLLSLLGILLLSLINSVSSFEFLPHVECSFYEKTKLPCPSCGLTRSFISMSNGNIKDAFNYNFIGIFLYIFLCLELFIGIIYFFSNKILIKISYRFILLFLISLVTLIRWLFLIINNNYL